MRSHKCLPFGSGLGFNKPPFAYLENGFRLEQHIKILKNHPFSNLTNFKRV